jgi:hypothetical protein
MAATGAVPNIGGQADRNGLPEGLRKQVLFRLNLLAILMLYDPTDEAVSQVRSAAGVAPNSTSRRAEAVLPGTGGVPVESVKIRRKSLSDNRFFLQIAASGRLGKHGHARRHAAGTGRQGMRRKDRGKSVKNRRKSLTCKEVLLQTAARLFPLDKAAFVCEPCARHIVRLEGRRDDI